MPLHYPYQHLNPEEYIEVFQDPLWYLRFVPKFKDYFWDYQGGLRDKDPEWVAVRNEYIHLVREAMESGVLSLGDSGRDWDRKRKPIDGVIIHHSQTPHDASFTQLDALCLIRLYVPAHLREGGEQFHKPIWSNHFYQDRQTFIGYHFLISRDGSVENSLKDECVGWHSGDVSMNLRSIGICFVGNLMESSPTPEALESAREIIARYNPKEILGHREVKENRTCPGNLFLGENGWKKELLIV